VRGSIVRQNKPYSYVLYSGRDDAGSKRQKSVIVVEPRLGGPPSVEGRGADPPRRWPDNCTLTRAITADGSAQSGPTRSRVICVDPEDDGSA
jgi:hypothetical protein